MAYINYALIAFAILLAAGAFVLNATTGTSSLVRKLNSHALRIESLEGTCSEMHSLLKALETRDRMRRVRAATTSSDGSTPNPEPKPGDPGWKAAMRLKLAQGKIKHEGN